jgi:cytosine/uracil/thiamine/allantoin permease
LHLTMSGVMQVSARYFCLVSGSMVSVADRLTIDQDPAPIEKRTWTGTTFALYWFSDLVTVSTWSAAASVVALGLTATDAIWITLMSAMCNAIPTGTE